MAGLKVYARAVLAAGCLALGAPALLGWSADRAVEARVARLLGGTAGVSYARVLARSDLGRVEIDGLVADRAGARLRIGRLAITRDGGAAPGWAGGAWAAKSAEVTADDVRVTLDRDEIRVPHLVMRGTDLSAEGLKALLDLNDAAGIPDRLAILTMASLSAPEVLIGDAGADTAANARLVLHGVSLLDAVGGDIGALSIDRVEALDGDAARPPVLETGHVDVTGLGLPLIYRIAAQSRTGSDTGLAPVFRSLSLRDVVVRADNGVTIKLGGLAASGLDARPMLLSPADLMTLGDKPKSELTDADRQVLADVVADAVGSVALGHLEVTGVDVAGDQRDPVAFNVRRAALDAVEPLKLGGFAVDDVTLSAQGTAMSLGHFVVGGYDASGALPALRQQITGKADPGAAPDLGQLFPRNSSLALSGLKVALPGKGGGMGPLKPGASTVDVPVFTAAGTYDADSGVATSTAFAQMRYDFSSDPSFRDLAQFGIDRMDASADYGISYDPGKKVLSFDRIAVSAAGLGSVALAASLGEVGPGLVDAGRDPQAAAKAAQAITFRSFAFDFENTGIVERVLPTLAARANASVPLFKAQMKAQAEISVTQALGPGPAASTILAAVKTFVDDPRTFHLAVTAPNGISVAAASAAPDPKALLGGLTVEATANQ